MSYTPLPAPLELFEREVLPLHPKPDEPFEHALWCEEFTYVFKELSLEFAERFSEAVHLISAENLSSEVYTIETPVTLLRSVNVEKLRSEMPEVFSKVVYLRCSDAERIIGRHMLYELSRELSPSRVSLLETANLGDLEKVLTLDEMTPFVKVSEKPGVPVVVRRA